MEATLEKPNLYNRMAGKIENLIKEGSLRPGDRLPSVREFSKQQGVSLSTTLQAYQLLEDEGYLEARPQSGYYVRATILRFPEEPHFSAIIAPIAHVDVDEAVARVYRLAGDPGLVPMGAACPAPELMPFKRLNRCLASQAKKHGAASLNYAMPPGWEPLRRQLARRALIWGCTLKADDFLITTGCSESLNLSLQAVVKAGDTVAVETPAYFGMLQAIQRMGLRALEIPTHPQTGIDVDALKTALSRHKVKAVMVSPNCQNPLGSIMPEENKKKLVELVTGKGIPLIEDDIYGDLCYQLHRPRAAKAYDKRGLVLLCSSFSKTLAPGYRVGWVSAGQFQDKVMRLKATSTVATTTLVQMALGDFLAEGGYDHHLRRFRKILQSNLRYVTELIQRHFPEGTRITRPQGGYLLWVQLPAKVDALVLHQKALDHKISIAPGHLFSPTQRYKNFIRLNCGIVLDAKVEKGLETLGRLVGGEKGKS